MVAGEASCQAAKLPSLLVHVKDPQLSAGGEMRDDRAALFISCSRAALNFRLWWWDQGCGEDWGSDLCSESSTLLQSSKLGVPAVVGARRGKVCHVWHLAGLLMGRVASAGTWWACALLGYLPLKLQTQQTGLSALDASQSSTLKQV